MLCYIKTEFKDNTRLKGFRMNKSCLLMFSLLGMLVAIDAMAKGTVTPSDQITILCRKI